MILSSKHKNNAALIAHESCHQEQQRRDGVLTFWWRYLTSKSWRLAYEVVAYKTWLKVQPLDIYTCAISLAHGYDLDLTSERALEILKEDTL